MKRFGNSPEDRAGTIWMPGSVARLAGVVAMAGAALLTSGCGEGPCDVTLPVSQDGQVTTQTIQSPDGARTIYATAYSTGSEGVRVTLSNAVLGGKTLENGILTEDSGSELTYAIDSGHTLELQIEGGEVRGRCTPIKAAG